MHESKAKYFTPHFPKYENVKYLLPILEGTKSSEVNKLISSIMEQTGTPQNPLDWSDPDIWIPERLEGKSAELAKRIWEESENKVNPRHIRGEFWLMRRHKLVHEDENGTIKRTEKGENFLSDDIEVYKEIDGREGILFLLSLITARTRSKRKDLLSEWEKFMKTYSNYKSMTVIKTSLTQRLRNLVARSLISREGIYYVPTDQSLEYIKSTSSYDPLESVFQSVNTFNEKQKEKMHELLSKMDPYRFEHLVCELLESMGYENVTVTSQSGDRGVDVIATVQFGITTITEVVQVKRHKGVIGRKIVDQLRGALPYHEAIRGTIITLSDFSKNCREAALYPGAAPITLINGGKLIELLFEHEIGITKQSIDLYKVDESYLQEQLEEDEE